MATGTTTVNFGAGADSVTTVITGQSGITAGALLDVWLVATATANSTVDDHWVESLQVMAGNIVPGVGFTIYAKCNVGRAYGLYTVQWAWL
jgi:hypothetical protein